MRASKRMEIHEAAVGFLEPLSRLHPSTSLPDSFNEARIIVERVEGNLGLRANDLLNNDSHIFAFSLYDRIFFLIENLQALLDQETSEQSNLP